MQGSRYVRALPAGVTRWMAQPASSVEALVYRYLARIGTPVAVNPRAMARALELEPPALAAALFVLNRAGSIGIDMDSPLQAPTPGWTGLGACLRVLSRQGAVKLVLCGAEGLCIASAGVDAGQAQLVSALRGAEPGWPCQLVLRPAVLRASGQIDTTSQALLELVRILLVATETEAPRP